MLQESGLQELEERVLGFLCTNSGSLKLLSTLDDAQRLLHQVQFLICNRIWSPGCPAACSFTWRAATTLNEVAEAALVPHVCARFQRL